jgi:hypothetical protein
MFFGCFLHASIERFERRTRINRLFHCLCLCIETIVDRGKILEQILDQPNEFTDLALSEQGDLQVQMLLLLYELALPILRDEYHNRHQQGTHACDILQPGKRRSIKDCLAEECTEDASYDPQKNHERSDIQGERTANGIHDSFDETLVLTDLTFRVHAH